MDSSKLLHADYLDIIYDNRNKEYGGYELRKHYNQRAGKALLYLFAGLGALISFSFITSRPADKIITNKVPIVVTHFDDIHPPKIMPKILPSAPPPPPPAPAASTKISVVPKIVHNEDAPDNPPVEPKEMVNAQPGLANTVGSGTGIGTDNTGTTGTGTIPSDVTPTPPAIWAPQMPQFIGDMSAWISSHIKYPDGAREEGIEGQVIIQFVVNEDGAVSAAKVIRGIGGGCDEEALRMVNSMPKWKPGKQNGVAVKVFFTIPIKFVLD